MNGLAFGEPHISQLGVYGVFGVLKMKGVYLKRNTPVAEDKQEDSRGVLDNYLAPFKINTPNTPYTPP